ncbi:MAG TPA: serine/threonine protein kinase, partial [Candidatus Limnocylindria bacterium]|nr:serine/threonine protein kinase [Candidatus Limnocylindria bacterium]
MSTVGRIVERIGRIGADPTDDEDQRRRKRYLAASAVLVLPAGIVWGLLYLATGERVAAAIPIGYSVLSSASLVAFARWHDFRAFRAFQLLFILLLPFLLQVALGGFVPASAVILWSLLCPFGALIFADVRSAARWFALFALLVVVSPFVGT